MPRSWADVRADGIEAGLSNEVASSLATGLMEASLGLTRRRDDFLEELEDA